MRPETFLEKFDLIADAPGAVEKLRGLIMSSAFSGDFSGEERSQQMPTGWAVDGAPTLPSIPASWKWLRGSEVFDVIRGVSYKKDDASDFPVEGSLPLLRANNIGNGINLDELVFVPRSNIRDEQIVRRGDILIAMSSGSKKLVGKAAPILTEFKGSFGAFCGIIRNKSSIPDEVLARYFQSPQYTSWVTAAGRGIGINNLGKSDLASLPIPTPPLAEQKRIVAKVDELMALCDRLEQQQKERDSKHAALSRASLTRFSESPTPENLNRLFHPSYTTTPAELRKTILTLAVQGKLVPQDPNDEPAEKLLARLEQERTDIAKKQGVRLPKSVLPLSPDYYPHDIPESWQWSRIGQLALTIDYGTSQKADTDSSKVPVYRMGNIVGGRLVDENLKYVDSQIDDLPSLYLKTDDILFNRTNSYELVGKAGIYTGPDNAATFASYLIRIRLPSSLLFPSFFNLAMNAPYFRQTQIEPEIVQQCGQANFNGTKLASTIVPLPPLAEQKRIVAKVDELMKLVDQLEEQLTTARTSAENLLNALLADLTSQKAA
jgi:type I restriction enzyme S subunit